MTNHILKINRQEEPPDWFVRTVKFHYMPDTVTGTQNVCAWTLNPRFTSEIKTIPLPPGVTIDEELFYSTPHGKELIAQCWDNLLSFIEFYYGFTVGRE